MVACRERVHTSYTPTWDGLIEQWTKKFISKHKWRCDSIHSDKDLLQDAYLIFLKISDRYPRVIDPPHFLSLFKKAMWNTIHDHSRYNRYKKAVHVELPEDVDPVGISRDVDHNCGPLMVRLRNLPKEVKEALIIIRTHPELLVRQRIGRNGPRENLNAMLWRIMGLDNQITAGGRVRPRLRIDFTGVLQQHLT